MNRILLPTLLAVVLAGCDGGQAQTSALLPSLTSNTVAVPPSAAKIDAESATKVSEVAPNDSGVAMASKNRVAPELPPQVREVVRLAQTTLGENILLSYIETITEPYKLSADQVIYLSDLGLSGGVVNALLKHESALMTQSPAGGSTVPSVDVAEVTGPQAPAGVTNLGAPAAPPVIPAAVGESGAPPAPPVGPPPSLLAEVGPTAPPATVINYNTFYESLSPYGSWVDVADYGYCWQPTVAVLDTGWQPYCQNGSWAWSDQGWYWNSGYSWGWAPFHYGRWHRSSHRGWVWQPGCDWGPAWVNWSYTGEHCAWAPLPPECHWSAGVGFSWWHGRSRASIGFGLYDHCWIGIGWSDFCRPNLHAYRVPAARVTEIVSLGHSSVVGDRSQVVNINGHHNTVIINNGAPYEKVRGATRDEIRKVAIADVDHPGESIGRRPGGNAERPVVAAYRPRLDAANAQPQAPSTTVLNRLRDEERKTAAAPANLARRPNAAQRPFNPTTTGAENSNRTEFGSRASEAPRASRPSSASSLVDPGGAPSFRGSVREHGPNPAPAVSTVSRGQSAPSTRPSETVSSSRPLSSGRSDNSTRVAAPSVRPSFASGASGRPAPTSPSFVQDPALIQNPSLAPRNEVRKPVSGASARPLTTAGYDVPTTGPRPSVAPSVGRSAPAYGSSPATAPGYSPPTVNARPAYSGSEAAVRPSSPSSSSARPVPNYSAPAFRSESSPSYSAPAPNRNFGSAPSSYSAPAPARSFPTPSPSYSAPAPAPVHPSPAVSSPPSHSNGGGGNNPKNGRER